MKIFIYDESRVLIRAVGTPDVMQGENNATLIFMSVAGIDETNFQNYLAQFAATIGTSHPADIITDFGTYVLDGIEYKGWKYFVSSKFTQAAGVLNANLVLSSNGSTLISQTVALNVNPSASGVTWFKNITQAQWEQLLAYCIGLRNPNLGELSAEGLDSYCNMGQVGGYLYLDDDGFSHLLFVGYDEAQDRVYQTDYYNNNGALICRQRYTTESVDDEWTNWVINSQASAISFNVTGLPQLTGANTVQKAIAALAHAVYPIAFVTSLAPSPFTSVDVPNSKDKIIKDDLGQDLNVGGVLDYAFAIFGRYNTHAFDFDNTLIMTSDGAIYRMKYENGSMVAHWFNGSPAQVKLEQSAVNQSLSEGISANNVLIKNNVVGNSAMTIDQDTYVITITNTNLNGQVLSTYSVDIPAEMAMVNASYDNTTKDLTFTLQNGNTVVVPLDDIISGLASQDWVNTAIANALLPYATTSWVDSNYMSLTKGGMVDLAEDPASANTNYFGASHGTKSFHKISDNSYAYRVSDGDGNLVQHNANKNGVVSWLKTANGVSTITKVPFKSTTGTHDLAFQEDLDAANAKISKQESDIQYLYRQVIGGGDLVTATDSGVALTSQPFPLTVSPKALLDYVGGMCQKVNQCLNLTGGVSENGVVWTKNQDGTMTISGTLTQTVSRYWLTPSNLPPLVSGHKYYFVRPSANISLYLTDGTNSGFISDFFTNNYGDLNLNYGCQVRVDGQAGDVINIKGIIALVDLTAIWPTDTPTTTSDARIQWLMSYLASHPEYDAGSIITAPVTTVVSKGFNLWDEETELGYINPYTGANQAVNTYWRSKTNHYYDCLPNTNYYRYSGSNDIRVYFYDRNKSFISYVYSSANNTFTTPANAYYFRIASGDSVSTPTYNHDICINVSSSLNGTYMPYRAPIEYPIPAEVRALEGYGLGKDSEHYNYIDYDRKVFVEETAIDGDDVTILAEPVETDISEYIESDVIEVSAGGRLEFENEDDVGVPYSTTYQCEPNTQEGE